jgi:CheY-like chemotaxis protein
MRYLAAGGKTRFGLLTADALYEDGVVVGGLGIMRDTADDMAARDAEVPRSVLIVEDEEALRSVVGRFFQRLGYEVVTVAGGAEALQQLQAREFGAVLLDLRMPGMSGEDTYREVLRLHPGQAERVVFMTGDLHSPPAAEFLRATGRGVVAKPFVLADLEQRVAGLLRAR